MASREFLYFKDDYNKKEDEELANIEGKYCNNIRTQDVARLNAQLKSWVMKYGRDPDAIANRINFFLVVQIDYIEDISYFRENAIDVFKFYAKFGKLLGRLSEKETCNDFSVALHNPYSLYCEYFQCDIRFSSRVSVCPYESMNHYINTNERQYSYILGEVLFIIMDSIISKKFMPPSTLDFFVRKNSLPIRSLDYLEDGNYKDRIAEYTSKRFLVGWLTNRTSLLFILGDGQDIVLVHVYKTNSGYVRITVGRYVERISGYSTLDALVESIKYGFGFINHGNILFLAQEKKQSATLENCKELYTTLLRLKLAINADSKELRLYKGDFLSKIAVKTTSKGSIVLTYEGKKTAIRKEFFNVFEVFSFLLNTQFKKLGQGFCVFECFGGAYFVDTVKDKKMGVVLDEKDDFTMTLLKEDICTRVHREFARGIAPRLCYYGFKEGAVVPSLFVDISLKKPFVKGYAEINTNIGVVNRKFYSSRELKEVCTKLPHAKYQLETINCRDGVELLRSNCDLISRVNKFVKNPNEERLVFSYSPKRGKALELIKHKDTNQVVLNWYRGDGVLVRSQTIEDTNKICKWFEMKNLPFLFVSNICLRETRERILERVEARKKDADNVAEKDVFRVQGQIDALLEILSKSKGFCPEFQVSSFKDIFTIRAENLGMYVVLFNGEQYSFFDLGKCRDFLFSKCKARLVITPVFDGAEARKAARKNKQENFLDALEIFYDRLDEGENSKPLKYGFSVTIDPSPGKEQDRFGFYVTMEEDGEITITDHYGDVLESQGYVFGEYSRIKRYFRKILGGLEGFSFRFLENSDFTFNFSTYKDFLVNQLENSEEIKQAIKDKENYTKAVMLLKKENSFFGKKLYKAYLEHLERMDII